MLLTMSPGYVGACVGVCVGERECARVSVIVCVCVKETRLVAYSFHLWKGYVGVCV